MLELNQDVKGAYMRIQLKSAQVLRYAPSLKIHRIGRAAASLEHKLEKERLLELSNESNQEEYSHQVQGQSFSNVYPREDIRTTLDQKDLLVSSLSKAINQASGLLAEMPPIRLRPFGVIQSIAQTHRAYERLQKAETYNQKHREALVQEDLPSELTRPKLNRTLA